MSGELDAIDRILLEGGEADDVLRAAVEVLVGQPEIVWAAVGFVENGELTIGPAAGSPDEARRAHVPISYREALVGQLVVDGEPDRTALERVAARIAPLVLIGWDTGGEVWDP